MGEINLKVKGMTCSSCEVLIERSLKELSGVEEVKVDRAKELVKIKGSDNISLDDLQTALRDKG